MLANTKHTKDRMVFSILSTLMFVTASSAIYDTPSANADMQQAPQANVVTYQMPAIQSNLMTQLPTIARLTDQIDKLQLTVEQKQAKLAAAKEQAKIDLSTQRDIYVSMDQALIDLASYVGKTPYGFGSTPARWDCSGLTLWFYETYRGITLTHSATKQMLEGEIVDAPIPGDLVAFSYAGSKGAFHIGIYIGSGMFIHAKNYNADTVLETVEGFSKNNIRVAYIRY